MTKKKHPSDYPQFSFRVSNEDKKRINQLASEILDASNTNIDSSTKKFRKKDILVDALYLGLLTLKKKELRLKRF